MRNWNAVHPSGGTHIIRAWSARHVRFITESSSKPFTPVSITLIGRANGDNEDGWRKPGVPKDKAAKK